jgi:sec-independent protein translocase protein TatA
MPNIGPIELIIILVIALIVIGPGRLPDVGAALGKSIREFRKASTDITDAARVDVSPQTAPAAAPAAPAPTAAAPAPNTLAEATTPNTITAAPSAPAVPAPVVVPPDAGDDATAPPA